MHHTILSIVPGRQRVGYAVFHNGMLVFYGIGSLTNFKTAREVSRALEKFLRGIVARFGVDAVAIRQLSERQSESEMLQEIFRHLKAACEGAPVRVCLHDGASVNSYFSGAGGGERPTNDTTALQLISRYPELARYREIKRAGRRQYYACLFQAIAVGFACASGSRPFK